MNKMDCFMDGKEKMIYIGRKNITNFIQSIVMTV